MGRLSLKLTIAAATVLVASAAPSMGQQFEYTPYNGSNNTGGQPSDPPSDAYTPAHQGDAQGYSTGAAAPAYQSGTQSGPADVYSGNRASAAQGGDTYSPSNGGYTPRGGSYSPTDDVYSPAPRGGDAPPPPPLPPRGVGGPPMRDLGEDLPRIEVQAAAPNDGIPGTVREHDARRAALDGWRSKVADRYGPEFSQWGNAIGKRVECHPDPSNAIICTASAQPGRGLGRR